MAEGTNSLFSRLPAWARLVFVLMWPVSLTYAVYRMWRTEAFTKPVRIVATAIAVILAAAVLTPGHDTPTETSLTPERTASSEESLNAEAVEPAPVPEDTPAVHEPEPVPPTPVIQTIEVSVTRVIDGDTIEVRMPDGTTEKVRFIGVDTPESTNQVEPYGREASAYTEKALANKTVYLETDAELRDKYDRLLAHVWLEAPAEINDASVRANLFNAHLLLAGYANLMTIPPNVQYVDYLQGYEREARSASAGLWGLPSEAPVTAPKPQPSAPAAASYIANKNTKKFHYASCSSVDDMKESNKVPYSSRDEAVRDGYVPCKRCNP